MMRSNFQKNIVLVGGFDLTRYDKYFFIKNNILTEEEIEPGSFSNSVGVTIVTTKKFSISILPNQVIFNENYPEKNEIGILGVAKKFVDVMEYQTVTAMGINFNWIIEENSNKDYIKLSQDFFRADSIKLFSEFFGDDNCAFGVYASRDYMNARLKLDIKPSEVNMTHNGVVTILKGIIFSFNYHFDIKSTEIINEIKESFKIYDSYKDYSERIVAIY